FTVECISREEFFAAQGTCTEREFSRFLHDDDELSRRERITTESQQAMIPQQDSRNGRVLLKLRDDVGHRRLRSAWCPVGYWNIFGNTKTQHRFVGAWQRLMGEGETGDVW